MIRINANRAAEIAVLSNTGFSQSDREAICDIVEKVIQKAAESGESMITREEIIEAVEGGYCYPESYVTQYVCYELRKAGYVIIANEDGLSFNIVW